MTSISIPTDPATATSPLPSALPLLQIANSHLILLADILETYSINEATNRETTHHQASNLDAVQDKTLRMTVLSQLKTDLVMAMNIYRIACRENAPLDIQLMKETDLRWRCNQCSHYLRRQKELPLVNLELSSAHSQNQQIRKTIGAVVRLKLLTHLRKLIPGPNALSLSWREILPGLRLWL